MTARCAQGAGGYSERDLRVTEVEVLDKQRWELDTGDVGRGRIALAFAEGDKMILPGGDLA